MKATSSRNAARMAVLTLVAMLLAPAMKASASDGVTVHKDIMNGPLVSRGTNGKLVYKPYTDKGDTIIDYSYAGYKASEEPIPSIPTVATLEPLPGSPAATKSTEGRLAYPEGPDSLARIQAALDNIAARGPADDGYRGALLLTRGTYYVNGQLTLKSGVVLRGEGDGAEGTVLVFNNPGGTAIMMGGTVNRANLDIVSDIADDYVPSGSKQVTVKDASGINVGDHIKIKKLTNQAWVLALDMVDPRTESQMGRERKGKPWKGEQYQVEHVRKVTAVEGNTIHFDVPLPQSIAKEHGGGRVIKTDMSGSDTLIGTEGLRVISNFNPSIKQTARGKDGGVEYSADEDRNLAGGIHMSVINGWVRNCTVMHTSHFAYRMTWALYVTVRDCKSLQPVSVLRGGRRYSFSNDDTSMSLIYNCLAEEGRHDYVTGSRDHGPIVFVKSRALNAKGPSGPHQRWATGVLFDSLELVDGGSIDVINRGYSGSGHGWAGANVVIWNSTAPSIRVENPQTPEQNFAIGNARTPSVSGDGFVENSGDPVESESLFVQQLIDRIGRAKAMEVLKYGTLAEQSVAQVKRMAALMNAGAKPAPVNSYRRRYSF